MTTHSPKFVTAEILKEATQRIGREPPQNDDYEAVLQVSVKREWLREVEPGKYKLTTPGEDETQRILHDPAYKKRKDDE